MIIIGLGSNSYHFVGITDSVLLIQTHWSDSMLAGVKPMCQQEWLTKATFFLVKISAKLLCLVDQPNSCLLSKGRTRKNVSSGWQVNSGKSRENSIGDMKVLSCHIRMPCYNKREDCGIHHNNHFFSYHSLQGFPMYSEMTTPKKVRRRC